MSQNRTNWNLISDVSIIEIINGLIIDWEVNLRTGIHVSLTE